MQKGKISIILNENLFNRKDKLLLAVSGGADSVVLAHLLSTEGYNFSFAHCNFKLRGKDSEKDEEFCKNLAKTLGVKFYCKQFQLDEYRKLNKLSVQMAARDLRYSWFNELLETEKLDYIVTAHNANDVIETFFINIIRGTGINGLKGIQALNGNVARPLLKIKKEEILKYAKANKIKFRTDKSNFEDKYERNFIRLKVIPLLKKLNPSIGDTILKNIERFAEENEILNKYFEKRKSDILSEKGDLILINKKLLGDETGLLSFLNYLISPFGFNNSQAEDISGNILQKRESGKKFHSKNYDLAIDRDFLTIKKSHGLDKSIEISSINDLKSLSLFETGKIKKFTFPHKNELIIKEQTLIFPLIVRNKKTGDKFKPYGMKGFKLLSDFLKDEKLKNFEREKVKLLVNGNGEIIWVMGYRSDERYKVNAKETNFLKLTLTE